MSGPRWHGLLAGACLLLAALSGPAHAQEAASLIELRFTPVERAQLAIWLEHEDGTFIRTVRLTEAVAKRGIGNRPGASQMNSGFRWPYGRREGVLPIWARRRVESGAPPFRRVIFQDRISEGHASRSAPDFSVDDYFCLSFNGARARKDALDAVSCASTFNSDKGRFVTDADIEAGYAEPYQRSNGEGALRLLSLESYYPPRTDITPCAADAPSCQDHTDTRSFNLHVHEVMPEIDAVTMATPAGHVQQQILFSLPEPWRGGHYRACVEINTEGDYNDAYNDKTYPTPSSPARWDTYALTWGYAYRGQPSVLYCVDFEAGAASEQHAAVREPDGSSGPWDFESERYGELQPMDGMSDDHARAPGSGADRLLRDEEGVRLRVTVKPGMACSADRPPSALERLELSPYPERIHAHQWAMLSFNAASDDHAVVRYEVRVATTPITDDASFAAAFPAKQATEEAEELLVPTDRVPGETIRVPLGGLSAETHYYIAARAMDGCTGVGPLSVGEFTTPKREFQTVTPCFVATAAYGDPLERRVGALRRFRDRQLRSNSAGRALVAGYYAASPQLAKVIAEHAWLRGASRALLAPWVALAERLD